MPVIMPMIIEKTKNGEKVIDIPSKLMSQRIILVDSGVDANLAQAVCAQLLYLDSVSSDDIFIYLNSPGGSCTDGMKIADTMDMCRSDISIIGSGILASMGCYLLAHGTAGKRFLTTRAQVMAHQVSSGTKGHVEDQMASIRQSEYINKIITTEIANSVGVTHTELMKDINRDFWLNAEESLAYGKLGFCDGIIDGKRDADGELIIRRREVAKKTKAKAKVSK